MAHFAVLLAAADYAQAHALMAAPYRDGHALSAFAKTCKGSRFSRFLRGARQASIFSTRRNAVAGSAATTYTFTGQGMLMTDGHELRILVLSIAGIPVLDGITGN